MRRLAFIFLILVFLCGLTAAAIYYSKPWYFTATSLVRISRDSADRIENGKFVRGSWEDFEIFRNTQVDLIRSLFVANAALRQPGIAPLVWQKKDPASALANAVHVRVEENSEVLTVSLRGPNKEELVRLLDAVIDTYMQETVHRARIRITTDLERLRVRKRRIDDKMARSTQILLEFEKLVSADDVEFELELQKVRIEAVNQTLISLELEALQTDDADKQEILTQRLSKVKLALQTEKENLAELKKDGNDGKKLSELRKIRNEVEKLSQFSSQLTDEIEAVERRIELEDGISVLHSAQIASSGFSFTP